MDDLRLDTLAGHLVDWHNRHPLARRITLAHVHSVGYVALPFAADKPQAASAGAAAQADVAGASPADGGDGASLRERAMARAQQQAAGQSTELPAPAPSPAPAPAPAVASAPAPAAQALFSENFIPPLKPKAVAAFAWQHGAASARPGKDGPVRQVLIDGAVNPARVQQRWLLTAQIDMGGARTRVLVGSGLTPAVLGRRLLRTRQLALGLALLLSLALAAALGWMRLGGTPPASMAPTATPGPVGSEAAASAALATVATESAASAVPTVPPALPTARTETTPAPLPASAPVAAPAAPAASAPVDVEPTLGRVQLPSLGPIIEERRQLLAAARQASAAAAAAAASAAGPAARTATAAPATTAQPPAAAVATPTPSVLAPPPGQTAFAVSTRLLRTRTEGELTADAMRELLSGPHAPGLRVEALRVGDDWRVVAWPYSGREGAEKARAMLAARGMRVQVIDF